MRSKQLQPVDCIGCDRTFWTDEDHRLCDACYIWQSDDCPACGGQVDGERFCTCDLNSPRFDTTYRGRA